MREPRLAQKTQTRQKPQEEGKPATLAFMGILAQPIRGKIVIVLYENVEMSYSELLNMLNIDEGLLNFHLRKMKRLVKTTKEGTYMLSEYGKLAYEVLRDVETRITAIQAGNTLGLSPPIRLTADLIGRRVAAFFLDAAILFVSTGLFLDRNVVALLSAFSKFQLPPLSLIDISYATVSAYSHVFFAAYLIFTVLEAYKGQTPGKYLLGIRVVKVGGRKISLMDSAVRNLGKVFLLPLDVLTGIILYAKKGYMRFFDYYTALTVERTTAA